MVKVYSVDNCSACKQTIDWLEARGFEFDVLKMDEDMDAYEYVKKLGYRKAPVVVTEEKNWAGFNEKLLKEATGS